MSTGLSAERSCAITPVAQGGPFIGGDGRFSSSVVWRPLLLAAIVTCSLLGSPLQAADGARVILIRHADKDIQRGDYNLSPIGFLRAIALGRLIPACYGKPAEISSFYLNPASGKNARSYQTAVPLAVATGVNIRIMESSQLNSYSIGQQIRERLVGTDALHVLFWEHRRMPELARGLGWSTMPPIADADFDQLIVFRYDRQARLQGVDQLRQAALLRRSCFSGAPSPWALEADLKPLLQAN